MNHPQQKSGISHDEMNQPLNMVYQTKTQGWIIKFIFLLLGIVAALVILSNGWITNGQDLLLMAGGYVVYFVLYLGALGLFNLAAKQRRNAEVRSVDTLLKGEVWASWQYTPDEWKTYNDSHSQTNRKRYAKQMSIPAPHVVFGPEGFYSETDGYTPLNRLVSAEYFPDRNPTQVVIKSWQDTGGDSSDILLPSIIPVPQGHEGEATVLVQQYQAKVQVRKKPFGR